MPDNGSSVPEARKHQALHTPAALAALMAQFERRAGEAEQVGASAPVASVYRAVLDELRAMNDTAPTTTPAAAPAPSDSGTGRYLTPKEVAALLQVPPGYPYRHVGQLGGVKVGKYLRFPESAIRRRLERSR
jgi:excisionase family DNA binding protein